MGADDDSFWEAGKKYIRRMGQRLKSVLIPVNMRHLYKQHGTHFVLPESLLRKALPVGLKFVLRFIFKAAKEYPNECEATRKGHRQKAFGGIKGMAGRVVRAYGSGEQIH